MKDLQAYLEHKVRRVSGELLDLPPTDAGAIGRKQGEALFANHLLRILRNGVLPVDNN